MWMALLSIQLLVHNKSDGAKWMKENWHSSYFAALWTKPSQHCHCLLGDSKYFQKESPSRLGQTKNTCLVWGDTQGQFWSHRAEPTQMPHYLYKRDLKRPKFLNKYAIHISFFYMHLLSKAVGLPVAAFPCFQLFRSHGYICWSL